MSSCVSGWDFSGVDQNRVSLTLIKPNATDAWFKPKPEHKLRLALFRIPSSFATKVVAQQTNDISNGFVLPIRLVSLEFVEDVGVCTKPP